MTHAFQSGCPCCLPRSGMSRRHFLCTTAAGVAAAPAIAAGSAGDAYAQAGRGRPILIKGGCVLSLDSAVGDFESADVLIEGKKISAVKPNISASNAQVIDAKNCVVMPGFVDTHHHQYETLLRSILSDGNLGRDADFPTNYLATIQGILTPAYRPEDAYISELVASLNQINAGVTTTVDTSQVSHTPAHTDACIAGLKESGRRAVFAYSAGQGSASQFPQDLTRLRRQYFSSNDQLLTLALHGPVDAAQWKLARSEGASIVAHFINGDLEPMEKAGLLGPDCEYIHCTQVNEATWKRIAASGGHVSLAPAIEMQMRHGMPPFLAANEHGIRPSLSVDVECNMTADMFSIMRAAFTLQRALVNQRALAGEKNLPRLLTCRDALEMATVEGARTAHLDAKIGTLAPGKEADIVMLATDRINVFPMNNVPGTVVTLMDTSNVENVFVAGRVMKWQGKLVGVDLAKIRRTIEQARDALLARAKYPRNLFQSCCVKERA